MLTAVGSPASKNDLRLPDYVSQRSELEDFHDSYYNSGFLSISLNDFNMWQVIKKFSCKTGHGCYHLESVVFLSPT